MILIIYQIKLFITIFTYFISFFQIINFTYIIIITIVKYINNIDFIILNIFFKNHMI